MFHLVCQAKTIRQVRATKMIIGQLIDGSVWRKCDLGAE
jgi:hypothetical protein